jgi:glycosyltransferase involved in cell wall biosynthesis
MHNMHNIKVALDITPMVGKKSGIGYTTEAILNELQESDEVEVFPYVLSFKARAHLKDLPKNTKIFPLPAKILLKQWQMKKLSLLNPIENYFFKKVDVIHSTNFIAPPSNKPTVINLWDCYFIKYPQHSKSALKDYAKIVSQRVKDGAHVVTGSKHSKQEVKLIFPKIKDKNLHSIHLGLNPLRSETVESGDFLAPKSWKFKDNKYLFFIGSTEHRKNLRTLIDAFKLLPKSLHLVIAGGIGNDEDEMLKKINMLDSDVRSRIHRLGYVDEDQRYWLFKNAATFCLPSFDEGFGIPVLESLQFGVPCALSEFGCLPEIGGEFARYYSPDNPDQMAEKINDCLQNESFREKVKTKGPQYAKSFTWEKTGRQYIELYKELLKQ